MSNYSRGHEITWPNAYRGKKPNKNVYDLKIL